MTETVPFAREDIGAELLPILTSGLYRDTLDALREYVQNCIDAQSTRIELVIDPDVVSVTDNGKGMNEDQARMAIRLGISEKNPKRNVGFRGIGIYSAFNLCNALTIHTRTSSKSHSYSLRFDFQRMREQLLTESERRKSGLPPALYLERLLHESVKMTKDDPTAPPRKGTTALLSGLLPTAYERLNEWETVTDYLENVVPLPFNPAFKFKTVIEERIGQESGHIVPLTLQVGRRREEIYRPYHDGMFTHGGQYPPKFFDVADSGTPYGFAWLCINDARKVLPDTNLRGILVKKFEFSVADRHFLEPFFHRTVFNRRITGELLVHNDDLIPNAARSDFEANSTRHAFFERALPGFIFTTTKWADDIQETQKSLEVLANASTQLKGMSSELPRVQRDRERLLHWNISLADLERQLRPHARRLARDRKEEWDAASALLKDLQQTVRSALVEQQRTRKKLEERIAVAVRNETDTTNEVKERLDDAPKTLVELLESYGLLPSPELQRVIRFLDEEFLQAQLSHDVYLEALGQLREAIEENS